MITVMKVIIMGEGDNLGAIMRVLMRGSDHEGWGVRS